MAEVAWNVETLGFKGVRLERKPIECEQCFKRNPSRFYALMRERLRGIDFYGQVCFSCAEKHYEVSPRRLKWGRIPAILRWVARIP